MDLEQLRVLGQELEVKGFKKMQKEDLVYAILDKEAEKNDEASKTAVFNLDRLFKKGPSNSVESFDGYIISSFEKARDMVKPKNYLDLDQYTK